MSRTLLRYADNPNGWQLSPLACPWDPKKFTLAGVQGTQPDWLRAILDVARLSGMLVQVPKAPEPTTIVWFYIDEYQNFLEFYKWQAD